jgi:hypothetical protein
MAEIIIVAVVAAAMVAPVFNPRVTSGFIIAFLSGQRFGARAAKART